MDKTTLIEKKDALLSFFQQNPRVALGFSGGVDSSYLLHAAVQAGAEVRPYYIRTAFQPQHETDDAMRMASDLGVMPVVLDVDILAEPVVAANPDDRCYYCKTALFGHVTRQAREDGYPVVLDGTNASDDADDRPGMRALRELSVRSPLRECGLTKADIRQLSREAGLFTWDKPAYACLATRVPSGTPLTVDLLKQVEGAEDALFQLGFSDFRVRAFSGAARIQLTADQMPRALEHRDEILSHIRPYFSTILLDMEARNT